MDDILCIDLKGKRDAAGRIPRSSLRRQFLSDKQKAAFDEATLAVSGRSPRRQGKGQLLELEFGNDGAPAHTTATMRYKRRKPGVRRSGVLKPELCTIRLIDYSTMKRSAKVSGTADGDRRRPLTSTDRDALERATADNFSLRLDTGARGAAIALRADDFRRVLGVGGCGRLSDAHINAYCELVNLRNARYFRSSCGERWKRRVAPAADDSQALLQGGRQRMFIFSSFLYTRLETPGYEYRDVKGWTAKSKVRVLEYGRLILPVNVNQNHWVLAAVDVQYKRVVYLDSLKGRDSGGVLQRVRQWFVDEVTDKYGEDEVRRLDIANWETVVNPPYVPQQKDRDSCGIFAVMLADYLEHGQVPDFSQADVKVLRERTALAIMRGTLPEYNQVSCQ